MIKRIKTTLSMAFCAATLLASFGVFSANSTAYAKVGIDDEKENALYCGDGQTVVIWCSQGIIDCTPKDCP